jgi:hypothetical protein
MRQLVREIVDVRESGSLDALIERLSEVRAMLPDPNEAVVRLRGDDIFGRLITITFSRPATVEELRLGSYGRA